ncbi:MULTISPECIES: glycerate kinase [unclassified Azospirillum]|uniref:glycerate kinase n=1 Tax=unclassified Azospirillum TaxID=2630922 RepID=UPI000B739BA1|nr:MULTISPECIES: glycerate kinase [unclassified Azospirillum]SNT16941.1 glycerate kinase [Azospirillum sp. RU38E]SNT29133.1 glycerate kinase [Azospirillum sp. RU37A]
MKILITPDSFKESLAAQAVAEQIAAGIRDALPTADCRIAPMADGGEGTVAAMVAALDGQTRQISVTGPLGEPVMACYGLSGQTAIIEMAAAAGLALVPPARRDPSQTTSFGVGELIRDALGQGVRHLIIGIGGSATNDGGAGMAQALGIRLLDAEDRDLPFGGGALTRLARIDMTGLDARLHGCRVEVACDVDNPLIGPHGASAIFGPQKGADAAMVQRLDEALYHLAEIIRRQRGLDVANLPGGGAAGGLGAGLHAFLGATLRPGVDIISQAIGLTDRIAWADLVITGEGRLDGQSLHGKVPVGVARLAAAQGKPVIAIAGSLGDGAERLREIGISAMVSCVPGPCTLEKALDDAAANIRRTARTMAELLRLGAGINP